MADQEELCLLTPERDGLEDVNRGEHIKCYCNQLVSENNELSASKSERNLEDSEIVNIDTRDTSIGSVSDRTTNSANYCSSRASQNYCENVPQTSKISTLSPFHNSSNVRNNFSINEFRDTIGICEERTEIENYRERKPIIDNSMFFYPTGSNANIGSLNIQSYVERSDDISNVSNNEQQGTKSLVSINSEIMEILSDLDSVLDSSIVVRESGSSELTNSSRKYLKFEHDVSSDYVEVEKVNNNLSVIRDNLVNIKNDLESIKGELLEVDDELRESVSEECDNINTSNETIPIHDTEPVRRDESFLEESSINVERATVRRSGRRDDSETREVERRRSMRLVSPLQLPSVPSTPPPLQELSLSAQLFLQTQDPERYSHMCPSSSTAAPRERGRRASTPRRCTSLHVQPRSTESASASSSVLSSAHSSPFHITMSRRQEIPHHQREDDDAEDGKERWPVRGGSALALLSCTLSAYSVCRFSLLCLHFGANFLVQFLFLSLMFGVPLCCLFASLGRALNAGPLGSWRVAPLFRGLGAALLLSQVLLAAYYVAGLSWLLVYFRDSFVSQNGLYRWADPFPPSSMSDGSLLNNTTHLPLSIPAYLSEVVLRRSESPTLPFQSLFHICLLWVAVALILCKGLASFGKVVFVVSLVPVAGLCAVCIRMLCLSPSVFRGALPYTNWGEFFINSKCWSAAAGECFMIWGLLAPTVWSLSGCPLHQPSSPRSPARTLLPALLLAPLTLISGMLITGAANTVIREHHYYYTSTSYEHPSWWIFLTRERGSYPRHATHHSLLLGVCVSRAGTDPSSASGLQPLRLATEIFPAAMALLSTSRVSSFWSILFYSSLIFLGISQLSVLTWGITAGIVDICPRALRSRRGVLSLACCAGLLLVSLPLARGLELIHLLDYGVVGIWWQCLLQVLTLAAFFLIRGRPYAADALASTFLSPASSLVPLLAFTWNVILPIAMIVECVVDFRVGRYRQVLNGGSGASYWGGGARVAVCLLQLVPPLLVPLFAVIQCWRYLSKGPPDILDRIQLLYRPVLDERGRVVRAVTPTPVVPATPPAASSAPLAESPVPSEDPPPKYTPPPSYSTATGARLAKLFTNSIRRSIRRVRRRLISSSEEGSGSSQSVSCNRLPLGALSSHEGYHSFREKKSRSTETGAARSSCTLPRPPRASEGHLHHSSAL